MRYVRKEIAIIDICDEDIRDEQIIKEMFQVMFKEQSDASVVFYDKPGEVPMSYEKVRISQVSESSVDLQIFRGGSMLKARGIPFGNFVEVKVMASSVDKHLKRNSGDRLRYLDTE